MVEVLEADYLVVGAGAAGMAFTDALIDHADVNVVMVDRRHGVGGHWLDAYPFVRLHQASAFYGVASTLLGGGRIQQDGPEAGLHERATAPEICAYYARVLRERMLASGKVSFYPNCDYLGDGQFVSRLSGQQYEVAASARIVDARYLAPEIPAATPAPFGVADGARVVAVNDLVEARRSALAVRDRRLGQDRHRRVHLAARQRGRPGRDLLGAAARSVDAQPRGGPAGPRRLHRDGRGHRWRRQPRPSSPDDLFLRLEDAGVMLRIDRSVTPTMAKTPTLAQWELDRLRTIEHVVRLGHIQRVEPTRLVFDEGEVATRRTP